MSKIERYDSLVPMLTGLLIDAPHDLSRYSNFIALLYQNFPIYTWIGFYFLHDGHLILGPFQGRVACDAIELGRGVCGLVVQNGEPHIAKDVRLLENYIACDNLTLSEIVLPLQIRGKIIGVLDIDSYILAAFDQVDLNGLQKLLNILSLSLNGQFAV
ncbi:MAG TPA: GAF domain-containing protein [Bacilli bacterium]|jgi:GAF domain-containing protein|nr:GAF domain-containing protein [Bacilli bacterium]MDD3389471.1 GAF domain-containing protein [Bacilli bacterium]MDD4345199.1 GAF domain-containing protein [Bacilli bacterium]MDD4520938.1 GAF domain-containing protein [Bacilli bacterium]MDY0399763.1 GAF domain-containing protein [Bacilli bacterium]